MNKEKFLKYLFIALRIVLGGIFVYASYYKIMSPGAFAHQIYNYKVLPAWAINPLAIFLPWLQLFCGFSLIFGVLKEAASSLILIMLIVFQAAVASALARGLNISCGCFNSGGPPASWLTFGRDSMLVVLSAVVFWLAVRKSKKNEAI